MSVKKSLVRNFNRYHIVFECSRFSLFALLERLSRGVPDEKSLKKLKFFFMVLVFLVKTARFVGNVPRPAGAEGQGAAFQQAPGGGVGHQAVVLREVVILPLGRVAVGQKGVCD